VRLADSDNSMQPVRATVGCNEKQARFVKSQAASGILGAGPSPEAEPTNLLQQFYNKKKLSVCLSEWGGMLAVGGEQNHLRIGPIPIQWVRMIDVAEGRYMVSVTGMNVNGNRVLAPFGKAMIDSGSTFTYLPLRAYNSLKKVIRHHCVGNLCGIPSLKKQRQEHCWDLQSVRETQNFPTIEILIESDSGKVTTTQWVPSAYMYRVDDTNTWCYSFRRSGRGAGIVLGASWMMKQEIVFDEDENRVGIAQAKCPDTRRSELALKFATIPVMSHRNKHEAQRGIVGPWLLAMFGGAVVLTGALFLRTKRLLTPKVQLIQYDEDCE